jgi:hypothetical protein
VTEDMVGLAEAAGERQHDAAATMIDEAADAVRQQAVDDGCLPEVRLAARYVLTWDCRRTRVPARSRKQVKKDPADAAAIT